VGHIDFWEGKRPAGPFSPLGAIPFGPSPNEIQCCLFVCLFVCLARWLLMDYLFDWLLEGMLSSAGGCIPYLMPRKTA
jgi:hypothetical protein